MEISTILKMSMLLIIVMYIGICVINIWIARRGGIFKSKGNLSKRRKFLETEGSLFTPPQQHKKQRLERERRGYIDPLDYE